jgi:hypothetical protein
MSTEDQITTQDVPLTYFKSSGKFYGEGTLTLPVMPYYEVIKVVQDLITKSELPGLSTGHSRFTVLVATPDDVPALLHP